MPTCDNCGSWVTKTYVRVSIPESERGIQCCPFCPDLKRRADGKIVKKNHHGKK